MIKLLPHLKDMSYAERLQHLKLPSLTYRCVWGDMINRMEKCNCHAQTFRRVAQGYKIQTPLSNSYHFEITKTLATILERDWTTQGNKMQVSSYHLEITKPWQQC